MKCLVIIRHAKAETQLPGGTDIARSLSERGKSDAVKIANQLFDTGIVPQVVISSSAHRAVETAAIFAAQYGMETIIKKEFLYGDYSLTDIQHLLSEETPEAETVFLIGHNPNLSYLLSRLTDEFHQHLSTSAVAVLEFDIEKWDELCPASGKLNLFLSHKEE
jgi:phosphohistidine phosphatase